jgi:mRNA interferase RelE/StbE
VNNYRVTLTTSAERELAALPATLIARIIQKLEHLATDPRPPRCKKLSGGQGEWRIRIGDYRVVYEIDDGTRSVDVTRIAHRREVYEH